MRDAHGTVLARGTLGAGWREGPVRIPLDRARSPAGATARLCLSNRGKHDIAVAGAASDPRFRARIGRRLTDGRMSVHYISRRRQSQFARADRIVSAMSEPGLWGGAAPWAAIALAGLALCCVVRTLW